jgi:hypothetical protein
MGRNLTKKVTLNDRFLQLPPQERVPFPERINALSTLDRPAGARRQSIGDEQRRPSARWISVSPDWRDAPVFENSGVLSVLPAGSGGAEKKQIKGVAQCSTS